MPVNPFSSRLFIDALYKDFRTVALAVGLVKIQVIFREEAGFAIDCTFHQGHNLREAAKEKKVGNRTKR